ncbi:MAG: tetratricopeptide repeat protein, partial [Bacteroidales bacterium]|nr:tetratricopeptide repeat protein [Bacteroidales bacterium]
KLDKVVNYLGQCLFQEELATASIRMFKYLLKKFPKSQEVPEALLGLERAYYFQKKYKQTLTIYFGILKRAANHRKLLNEARYLAGQSHYNLRNYDMAINVLKKIDSHSDFYDCALYTTALSYLKKSNVATSVDYFRKITSLPIISGERRNIVDNGRLTLGMIYYELMSYKAAIDQLSQISTKHEYYQDALLGLGWAYLKINDYENVIKNLNKLIKRFPDSANAEESYFLLGQAHIALGQYDEAITSYSAIVNLYPEKHHVPNLMRKVNNSLRQEENRVEELKVKILVEETRLLDVIPLNGYGEEVPQYLIEEKNKLKKFREKMIKNLLTERDHLLLMQQSIDDLSSLAERRERRKNWRGYAEYGISRSLFLKQMQKREGN